MKDYQIKLYGFDGTFIKAINGADIISDINFTESINAGQGQLQLSLNMPFNTTEFDGAKLIRIYCTDENNIDGRLIYSGIITQILRNYENNKEYIQIVALGLFTLLSYVYYKDSGNIKFTKNDDPADIIKEIIDYFNTKYSGSILSYSLTSVQAFGSSINKEFNESKCDKAIQDLIGGLQYYLFVGADGVVNFKPKPTGITHKFTYGKDIVKINIKDNTEKISNAVSVVWSGGTTSEAQDSTSISENGLREIRENKTDIKDVGSAETYRDSFLNINKNSQKVTSITINNLYDLETIHPGDTIEVRNFDYEISGLQIVKVNYTYNQVTIELEDFTNLATEIFN